MKGPDKQLKQYRYTLVKLGERGSAQRCCKTALLHDNLATAGELLALNTCSGYLQGSELWITPNKQTHLLILGTSLAN